MRYNHPIVMPADCQCRRNLIRKLLVWSSPWKSDRFIREEFLDPIPGRKEEFRMKRSRFTEQQIAFAPQQACEWQANPLLCAAPRFTPTPISRAIFRIPLSPLRRACWIACSTDSSTLGLPSFIPFNLALAALR